MQTRTRLVDRLRLAPTALASVDPPNARSNPYQHQPILCQLEPAQGGQFSAGAKGSIFDRP
jgi:hypothetical protein